MDFLLLGPLEVSDGGVPLNLGGPKQRTLLAHLVLQANQVVTVERLIDALWGEEPPETARNTIQTYVRHLRKALGAARIEHRSAGYVVHAAPDEVDLERFIALLPESGNGDPAGAAVALQSALALWRGSALDDLSDQPSLQPEIARLEALRMVAIEDRIAAELSLGRHRGLISELEGLTARYPFRERLWAHLMTALYRSGRQADALTVFQRARRLLSDELGIDPSPDLQRLQEGILRQDQALEITGDPLRGYRLLDEIGTGAIGTVHRAYQPQVGREVVIKAIDQRIANDPDFIRRFEPEAQLVGRLEHPHIVPLYDFWREPGAAYLVMRYLRGGSLEQRLGAGPLDPAEAVTVVEQLARAVDTAHQHGVVHGNIKPSNVLFDEDGHAYLTDFTIAKDLAVASTPTADLRSLGVLASEMFGGRASYAEAPRAAVTTAHPSESPASLRSIPSDLPAAVDQAIARATAEAPAAPFPDATALAVALAAAVTQAPADGSAPPTDLVNPYKGLRPFEEADAADFFGREALVSHLVEKMDESRLLAVVGPSGSGKSSLVRAGLIPALRHGGSPGSDTWFVVEMHPGASPFDELVTALLRVSVAPPPDIAELIEQDAGGLAQVVASVIPAGSELLLVIDQFEELFTLVADEAMRAAFLDALDAAISAGALRVVVTLRADFYDRPLLYPGFGELLAASTAAITPLTVEELERAVSAPAARVGVAVDAPLLAEMVAEVASQPGALPLFQYALTELFERRRDARLTLDDYREIGGVTGALARRAEQLYSRLNDAGKEAARQLFLRLVAVGDGGSTDARRRVLRTELTSLEGEREAMEAVISTFGARRLLSFDRDPVSRGPTVEVAHEALLREWGRLRGWIESAREQLVAHRRLTAATQEWLAAGRDEGFLLSDAHLNRLAVWDHMSGLSLTADERAFLAVSRQKRDSERAAEDERRARVASLERRSIIRMRALVAVLTAAAVLASGLTVVAIGQRGTAQRQTRLATARALAAAATASLVVDPERSVLLALHAIETTADDDLVLPEAVQALQDGVAADRLLLTLDHPSTANVKWSPDGRLLATGGTAAGLDQTDVVVWDAATGAQLQILRAHTADISELAFSADSSMLATLADDRVINVWDTRTWKIRYSRDGLGDWLGASFGPGDGRLIIAGEGSLMAFDAATGDPIRDWSVEVGGLFGIPTHDPSGARIAAVLEEKVGVFDAKTGREILRFAVGKESQPYGMVFSPDGRSIATLVPEESITVSDARTGRMRFSLHGSSPIGLDWSADGRYLATGENDGTARLWDATTGERLLDLAGHTGGVAQVAFSPDGTRLVTGGSDDTARVWDIRPEATAAWLGASGADLLWNVAFSADGDHLLTGGVESVWTWDVARKQRIHGWPGWGPVATAPSGGEVAFVGSGDGVRVVATDTGRTVGSFEPEGWIRRMAFLGGDRIVTVGQGLDVRTFAGKRLWSQPGDTVDVAASPDGSLVASLSLFATLSIHDAATGTQRKSFQAHSGFGGGVAFAPDGSQIATTGADGAAVWTLEGELLSSMSGAGRLGRVAFSPDGATLATAGVDGVVRLWDVPTGDELLALRGHTQDVNDVAFSPDGTKVASVGDEGTLRVWTLPVEQLIAIARARLTRTLTDEECRRYLRVEACPTPSRASPSGVEAGASSPGPDGVEGAYRVVLGTEASEDDRHVGVYTMSFERGRYRLLLERTSVPRDFAFRYERWHGAYEIDGDRITFTEEAGSDPRCVGATVSAALERRPLRLSFTDVESRAAEGCGIQAWTEMLFSARSWLPIP